MSETASRPAEATTDRGSRNFPETRWDQILKPTNKDNKTVSLEYLTSHYWAPVYAYIRAKWGKPSEEAKDLTQEFFAELLEKNTLANISPSKGKLRNFIKACLKNFLIRNKIASNTAKRGGNKIRLNLNGLGEEKLHDKNLDPERLFDFEWAKTLIINSIEHMKSQLINEGKEIYFKVFEIYNSKEDLNKVTYKSIALELGIKQHDVRNYLVHSRQLLQKILIKELKKQTSNCDETINELDYLLSVISK
jgi:RNA polymerase sigma-70 factor (ECF subfamily)